jgi:hypothetical protein
MNWIVRHVKWIMLASGALIALVGGMLIYGAYHPPVRSMALAVAGLSKLTFIGLVLAQGSRYLGQAALAISIDLVTIALFSLYLFGSRRHAR